MMNIVCTDLEGVLVPEIWIKVAERTGIDKLRLTTREIADYDELMGHRLKILKQHGLTLPDIQSVIAEMVPFPGALDFLNWLRSRTQVIVLSDTFTQFAGPLMAKLNWPTLFCNTLEIDPQGGVNGYVLRQSDGKRRAIEALRGLNYSVIAMGDSHNDLSMLATAHHGILFRPPESIQTQYPQFPVAAAYDELRALLETRLDAGSEA
ncbi:MAG: bifunctional phosphoserine phosphatase/homoserine phosphotransferase ThrH [Desulfobacterales bacterium]